MQSPHDNKLLSNFLFLYRVKNLILIKVVEFLYNCQHLLFIQGKLIFSWSFLCVCRCLLFQKVIILCKNAWDVSAVVTSLSLALSRRKFVNGLGLRDAKLGGRKSIIQWTVFRACLLQYMKNKWFECEAYYFTQRMTWGIIDCTQKSSLILVNVLCICFHFLPKYSPNFSGITFTFNLNSI